MRDEDEALDACQDVFVRLIEHRQQLDARYPSSLLYRIATNVCLNRIRDRGRRPLDTATGDEERIHAIACAGPAGGESDARMLLDWLFNRHPESSRTIAVLHYVDGLTLEQVAGEVGLSVSGVRKRLGKLRATVRGPCACDSDCTPGTTCTATPSRDGGLSCQARCQTESDNWCGLMHACGVPEVEDPNDALCGWVGE